MSEYLASGLESRSPAVLHHCDVQLLTAIGGPAVAVAGEWLERIPSNDGVRLAHLLRGTQWSMDDIASNLPAGRATPQQLRELAVTLEHVAVLLRAQSGEIRGDIEPEYDGQP